MELPLLHICSMLKETYGMQLWNCETYQGGKKNNQNETKLEIWKILAQCRKIHTDVGPGKIWWIQTNKSKLTTLRNCATWMKKNEIKHNLTMH